MSKVFYPTNLGGMSINWVDYLGSTKNSTNKSELLIDHIATMSNENNGKDVYINFFEKIDRIDDETAQNQYKTFLRINITEAIKHDLEWIEMNNKSINDPTNSHYINLESLSITDIDVNDDFKFIRIHYDFCQNHFACSCSRRRMVGAVYRLHALTSNKNELFACSWDGPIVFW